jgi:molecular chaperone DnaJ
MMAKDLYEILGVSRSANDTEIKKAYRKLAREYHPDVNKDPGAQDKFKEVQKAYDILSDTKKKAQYDQFGVTDDQPGAGGFGGGGFGGFSGFGGAESFEDIFDSFFGGGGRQTRRKGGPRQGEDLRYDLEISLEEAAQGVEKKIEIYHLNQCQKCDGTGAKPGTSKTSCSKCNGSGQVHTVQRTILGSFSQVSACPECRGAGEIIKSPCTNCHGKGLEKQKRQISVKIPAGVDSGNRLRVSGEGNHGEGGGPAGDLYVFISVKSHAYFKREEDSIYLSISLPYVQLVLGTEVTVPTLSGKTKLKVPAGTQPGTMFRLKGKGVAHLQKYGTGDQYVEVNVAIPKTLNSQEKKIVQELADLDTKFKANSENEMAFVNKL